MYYVNLILFLLFCIKRKREREKKMKNEMLYIKSGFDYCILYFFVGNFSFFFFIVVNKLIKVRFKQLICIELYIIKL